VIYVCALLYYANYKASRALSSRSECQQYKNTESCEKYAEDKYRRLQQNVISDLWKGSDIFVRF
jgi:hypothetical protein